jgi:outer membrane receptor for ferrienterochelin and colicins
MKDVGGLRLFVCLTSFAVAWVLASPAAGQSPAQGSGLAGVVRDGSGGQIPSATVVVRQDPSGLERVIEGAADGSVEVPLPQGSEVTVSAVGFAAATLHVEIPQVELLTVTLSPAPVVEQVVVVSGSREQELREALNARVDVVTRSRIDETGGQETVGEILRELPGVVTRRGSETAGAVGEQIQGIDSRQILVLIDGQPIVGARGIKRGGIINLDRQSTARLERVEVVKGAASALYGSDALGGVINLISREPSSPFDVNVALSAGSLGMLGELPFVSRPADRSSHAVLRHEHHQQHAFARGT